ncbi:hypothetical protein ACFWYW_26260 [Nonomuraea sp. NPDC059023]|uniref:hypothetical protein n=1 Tax=unclassified Nonomuraea TaxID=2593643 RepID=UPI0036A581E3
MSRWRVPAVASFAGLAAIGLFILPAEAETASIPVNYLCTGGIADQRGPVNLKVDVTAPTTLRVGGQLRVNWSLAYDGQTGRFSSPGYFGAGSTLHVNSTATLGGSWAGALEAAGSEEQKELKPWDPLALPKAASSEAHLTQPGTLTITPSTMTVDFLPAAAEAVTVNDDDTQVKYAPAGAWAHKNSTPVRYKDHDRDVHRTTDADASASFTFTGTGVEYYGRRHWNSAKVKVYLDPSGPEPEKQVATVDPTLDDDGTPTNRIEGNTLLWESEKVPVRPAHRPHRARREHGRGARARR